MKIEDTPHSIEGLCAVARKLGYRDPLSQMQNRDGSCVGDFLYFLEDNPGAIEAMIDWVLENYQDEIEDDDAEENEDA